MQPQARIIEEVIKTDVKTGKTKKYKHQGKVPAEDGEEEEMKD